MPFNLLLLPLLGGYFFITYWNYTRFDAIRYSGHRLLFHSAAAGVVFLILSFCVTRLSVGQWPELGWRWRELVPFEYSGTSLLAFLMGISFWWPLNQLKWFEREMQAQNTIESGNDYLEMMLAEAQRELKLVAVVLISRKVYIGFVTASFDPVNDRDYVQLLPLQSGYREPTTLQLNITTDYSQVYDRIIKNEIELTSADINDFQVVVPVSEIASINFFDQEAYELFNADDVVGNHVKSAR